METQLVLAVILLSNSILTEEVEWPTNVISWFTVIFRKTVTLSDKTLQTKHSHI